MPWINITSEEHHSGKFITSSKLKAALGCGAKYKQALETPKEDNDGMRLGRATHMAVFEPHLFAAIPSCPLGDDGQPLQKRSNADKATWAQFLAATRDYLSPDERAQATAIAEAVRKEAAPYLSLGGVAEMTGTHDDDVYGTLAIRPDFRVAGIILDLKTCGDASPDGFLRTVFSYGYDLQAAFYSDVAGLIDEQEYTFLWIAVEREAPYACQVYQASRSTILLGRQKYERALRNIRDWQEWDTYPANYTPSGTAGEVIVLNPPAWAEKKEAGL